MMNRFLSANSGGSVWFSVSAVGCSGLFVRHEKNDGLNTRRHHGDHDHNQKSKRAAATRHQPNNSFTVSANAAAPNYFASAAGTCAGCVSLRSWKLNAVISGSVSYKMPPPGDMYGSRTSNGGSLSCSMASASACRNLLPSLFSSMSAAGFLRGEQVVPLPQRLFHPAHREHHGRRAGRFAADDRARAGVIGGIREPLGRAIAGGNAFFEPWTGSADEEIAVHDADERRGRPLLFGHILQTFGHHRIVSDVAELSLLEQLRKLIPSRF